MPFEKNHDTHEFKAGTHFDTVLALYNFDRELRLLILDAIERIENSMRTQWTYHIGHNHGSHAHLDEKLAINQYRYEQNLEIMKREVERSDEIFIRHAKEKYVEPMPAIWVVS